MNDAQLASDSLSTDQSNHAAPSSVMCTVCTLAVSRERWALAQSPATAETGVSGAGRETLNSSVRGNGVEPGLGWEDPMIFDGQSFETWSVPGT